MPMPADGAVVIRIGIRVYGLRVRDSGVGIEFLMNRRDTARRQRRNQKRDDHYCRAGPTHAYPSPEHP